MTHIDIVGNMRLYSMIIIVVTTIMMIERDFNLIVKMSPRDKNTKRKLFNLWHQFYEPSFDIFIRFLISSSQLLFANVKVCSISHFIYNNNNYEYYLPSRLVVSYVTFSTIIILLIIQLRKTRRQFFRCDCNETRGRLCFKNNTSCTVAICIKMDL